MELAADEAVEVEEVASVEEADLVDEVCSQIVLIALYQNYFCDLSGIFFFRSKHFNQ